MAIINCAFASIQYTDGKYDVIKNIDHKNCSIKYATENEGYEALSWARKIIKGLEESIEWDIEDGEDEDAEYLAARKEKWEKFVKETNDTLYDYACGYFMH